jgi:hypothetical protein
MLKRAFPVLTQSAQSQRQISIAQTTSLAVCHSSGLHMCGIELITLASNKRSQRGDRDYEGFCPYFS